MYHSCYDKQRKVKSFFDNCLTQEAKYQKMIELGRQLPNIASEHKTHENLVKGCQSTMYLRSFIRDGLVFFEAGSDALISAGLVAMLLHTYNGETPETILKCPPTFLDELGIHASLTPSRSNGLYSIHLRMKQEALRHLLKQS